MKTKRMKKEAARSDPHDRKAGSDSQDRKVRSYPHDRAMTIFSRMIEFVEDEGKIKG